MVVAQVSAVIIFLVMFALIITEKIERQWVTLGCALLTLVFVFGVCMHSGSAIVETLNYRTIFTKEFWYAPGSSEDASSGINWATIIFITGMMVMVEGMANAGFFRWLCLALAKAVRYKTKAIFATFMVMSTVLAMFIDSITVILFLAAVTVELSRLLKFNPVPMILSQIFCANLGGAATMCGDPPNIIIGTSLGYSFADFVKNTGVIVLAALILTLIFFYITSAKQVEPKAGAKVDISQIPSPSSVITGKFKFAVSSCIFACAIAMLVTHAQTGLTVAFIGLFIAMVTLIFSGKEAIGILKKVDYKTLLFFIGLFVVVGGLEQTGILEIIANFISKISGGNAKLMVIIIIWISAIASAFIDNIPFAATMVPVIKDLAATSSVDLSVLAWALAIGTDIGGSATPIGASANVVGTSVCAKAGYPVSWKKYLKTAVPATILVLLLATVIILLRYHL